MYYTRVQVNENYQKICEKPEKEVVRQETEMNSQQYICRDNPWIRVTT